VHSVEGKLQRHLHETIRTDTQLLDRALAVIDAEYVSVEIGGLRSKDSLDANGDVTKQARIRCRKDRASCVNRKIPLVTGHCCVDARLTKSMQSANHHGTTFKYYKRFNWINRLVRDVFVRVSLSARRKHWWSFSR